MHTPVVRIRFIVGSCEIIFTADRTGKPYTFVLHLIRPKYIYHVLILRLARLDIYYYLYIDILLSRPLFSSAISYIRPYWIS